MTSRSPKEYDQMFPKPREQCQVTVIEGWREYVDESNFKRSVFITHCYVTYLK